MKKIVDIIKAKPEILTMKAPDVAQINQAEDSLNLRFAEDYHEYTASLGAVSYHGHELTGICASQRLNVICVTQKERIQNPNVPADWYVIEQTNIDGIVIWQDASGAIYQTMPGAAPQKIYSSLSEYVIGGPSLS